MVPEAILFPSIPTRSGSIVPFQIFVSDFHLFNQSDWWNIQHGDASYLIAKPFTIFIQRSIITVGAGALPLPA
jgi:hypothetical protein